MLFPMVRRFFITFFITLSTFICLNNICQGNGDFLNSELYEGYYSKVLDIHRLTSQHAINPPALLRSQLESSFLGVQLKV